jgi:hypothetical protein
MPLLLSSNCFVKQVHSYRQDKGKMRNWRTLSRDPLGGGVVQILLVPSCVALRFATLVAGTSESYTALGFMEGNLRISRSY